MKNELTDRSQWESYYGERSDDVDKIIRICSRYDTYWQQLIDHNQNKEPDSLIEIGGYPGRYITYVASKYQLSPTSLDFNSDKSTIEKSFELFGIDDYDIIQADFLKHVPNNRYDVVFSNGFIEHFQDFPAVMDKHVSYMKE